MLNRKKVLKLIAVCLLAVSFSGAVNAQSDHKNLDSLLAKPYNKPLSTVSTVETVLIIASPGLLAIPALKNGQTGTMVQLGLEYAAAAGGAWMTKELLKHSIDRARPYLSFPGYPENEKKEWYDSFPSGHTTVSFAAAGYGIWRFCTLFPESRCKWLAGSALYVGAASVAALRVASGNHYFSDVAAGALLGTLWGLSVPAVCDLFDWKIQPALNGVSAVVQW